MLKTDYLYVYNLLYIYDEQYKNVDYDYYNLNILLLYFLVQTIMIIILFG